MPILLDFFVLPDQGLALDLLEPDIEMQNAMNTLVSRSPRSPRKSPGIRIVDEFGREQVSNDGDDGGTERLSSSPSTSPKKPKSNHVVRFVDAMGREVKEAPEPSPESNSDDDPQLSRNEALTRLKQGILDLANGLSDADR
jgi:hypothetical protein